MITLTEDMEVVNSILQNAEIWKDIADEGVAPFDIPHKPELLYYLVNKTEGVIIVHTFREGCKIHPNILPDKRGVSAYKAVEEVCQELFALGIPSIYAEIDRQLKHVSLFARHLGFKMIGLRDRGLFIRTNLTNQ